MHNFIALRSMSSPEVQVQLTIIAFPIFYGIFYCKVNITYPAGKRAYIVKTPARKKSIKQLARRCYKAFSGTISSQSITSRKVVMEISRNIKMEMKKLSSNACDALLNDTFEAVKHFHWNTVWLEYEKELPILM